MTLKELFDKVEFKDLASILVKNDPKSESCLWLFKQAFDRMRQIPVGEDDGVVIEVKGWQVWSPSQTHWDKELAREVKAAKSAPLRKVAAAILWELTFMDLILTINPNSLQTIFSHDLSMGESMMKLNLMKIPIAGNGRSFGNKPMT